MKTRLLLSLCLLGLTACEVPAGKTAAMNSAKRIGVGTNVTAGSFVHVHHGPFDLTKEVKVQSSPGLNVASTFQGAVNGGRSAHVIGFKSEVNGRVTPDPSCDVQVFLSSNSIYRKPADGGCRRMSKTNLGITVDQVCCDLVAVAYSGPTGERLGRRTSSIAIDTDHDPMGKMQEAARRATINLAVGLGLATGQTYRDSRPDGFAMLERVDDQIFASEDTSSTTSQTTKPESDAESSWKKSSEQVDAVFKPVDNALDSLSQKLKAAQQRNKESMKRNWQRIKDGLQ